MSGPSSPNLLSYFKFVLTWSETKTLQIVLESFWSTHPLMLPSTSPRDALLACPPFHSWNPLSLWSPPFSLHALVLISLSLTKMRLSLTLTLSHLVIWCFGLTALFLFLLAKALWRTCQLLLWHRGHSFLFIRPNMLKFFR